VACTKQVSLSSAPVHGMYAIQIFLSSFYIFAKTLSAGRTRAPVYAQFVY